MTYANTIAVSIYTCPEKARCKVLIIDELFVSTQWIKL